MEEDDVAAFGGDPGDQEHLLQLRAQHVEQAQTAFALQTTKSWHEARYWMVRCQVVIEASLLRFWWFPHGLIPAILIRYDRNTFEQVRPVQERKANKSSSGGGSIYGSSSAQQLCGPLSAFWADYARWLLARIESDGAAASEPPLATFLSANTHTAPLDFTTAVVAMGILASSFDSTECSEQGSGRAENFEKTVPKHLRTMMVALCTSRLLHQWWCSFRCTAVTTTSCGATLCSVHD